MKRLRWIHTVLLFTRPLVTAVTAVQVEVAGDRLFVNCVIARCFHGLDRHERAAKEAMHKSARRQRALQVS